MANQRQLNWEDITISANFPKFSDLLTSPTLFLAFGFGRGLSPRAPGTVGTLMAVPLWLLLSQLSAPVYWSIILIAAVLGIYICGAAAKQLQVHDHPGIVWDEFVGFWIVMPFVPSGPWSLALGFLLFRFFDVIKPWPISLMDKKIGGGLGIMLDDVIAGIAAALVAVMLNHLGYI